MSERHLILGGGGFIGRHVAALLVQEGRSVTIADHRQPDFVFPTDIQSSIKWRLFEFASADWDRLVAEAEVVHHYVWTSLPATANANPAGDLNSNVIATLGLLEALRRRGGGRVVFSSSGGAVYGRAKHIAVREDHPLAPITAYGAGKATAEVYLGLYRALYGVDCRIARISNPYGAGQNVIRGQGAVTTFIHSAIHGTPITIWGDGTVVRDYIHISDVATALLTLATAESCGDLHVFNIGTGVGLNLNQVLEEVERLLGCHLRVTRTPPRPFDVPVSVLDISRIRNTLGWSPELTLSSGIERTFEDIRAGAPVSRLR